MNGLVSRTLATVILLLMNYAKGITLDNDIIGDPDIECLDEHIRIFVKTRNIFNGRIYAKGKADNSACSKEDFALQKTKRPHMLLKFGTCGMKSLRSVDPRGMYYGITVVVSFHTMFITKIDQAFHVKCFFEEASRGLIAELGFLSGWMKRAQKIRWIKFVVQLNDYDITWKSDNKMEIILVLSEAHKVAYYMIATTEVEARHAIPGCSYTIHASSISDLDAGKPAGPKIKYARIGDRILHQWHCDDQMFGILINNCYVTDGFGKRAEVVDSKGCSIDPILITGIRYSADLQRAYAESSVFKFADRPGVWFFCQIQMCMKKSGMCGGITPPLCDSEDGNAAISYVTDGEHIKAIKRTKSPVRSTLMSPKIQAKWGLKPQDRNSEIEAESVEKSLLEEYQKQTRKTEEGLSNSAIKFGEVKRTTTIRYDSIYAFPEIKSETSTVSNNKTVLVTTIYETGYQNQRKANGMLLELTEKSERAEADYKDLPSNLNELLANLPDDVSADSLQKMFHDSVKDRRALVRDFDYIMNQKKEQENEMDQRVEKTPSFNNKLKLDDAIKIAQASWDSNRMADNPMGNDLDNSLENKSRFMTQNSQTVAQMMRNIDSSGTIAGQLIIYDLDEEPPAMNQFKKEANSCSCNRKGLLIIVSSLSAISTALSIAVFLLYLRLSEYSRFYKEFLLAFSKPKSVRRSFKTIMHVEDNSIL